MDQNEECKKKNVENCSLFKKTQMSSKIATTCFTKMMMESVWVLMLSIVENQMELWTHF